jgi:hypothetical protein
MTTESENADAQEYINDMARKRGYVLKYPAAMPSRSVNSRDAAQ